MRPLAFALHRPAPAECGKPTGLGLYHFDARGIDERFRDAAVFAALEALGPGETMRYYDDGDPLPLLVALENRFKGKVSLNWISRNPSEAILDFRMVHGN